MSHAPLSLPHDPLDADSYFGVQSAHTADLPDPEPLLVNITRCVLEVFAGARDLEQLGRWVTDSVYRSLLRRTLLAARAREVKGVRPKRPQVALLRTIVTSPCDGVIEGVVIVRMAVRVRSVAIRLEGLDSRWRASAISVL